MDAIDYARPMRLSLLLLVFGLAACVLTPNGQAQNAAALYCLGPAQPRTAYLAAHYQTLVPEVQAGTTFVLNEAERGVVRVAKAARGLACQSGEESIALGAIWSRVNAWRSGEPIQCSLIRRTPREQRFGDNTLLIQLLSMGVGTTLIVGHEMTVRVTEGCDVMEPIVRALTQDDSWRRASR